MPAAMTTIIDCDSIDAEFRGVVSGLQQEFQRLHSLNNKLELEVSSMQTRRQTALKADNRDSPTNGYARKSFKKIAFGRDETVGLLQSENSDSLKDEPNMAPCGISFPITKPSNSSPCVSPRVSTLDLKLNSNETPTFRSMEMAGTGDKAMLRKTMSMAFDSGEARFKTRDERLMKLRDWFDRLTDFGEGLSASHLRALAERVQGSQDALGVDRIHALIKSLDQSRSVRNATAGIEGGILVSDNTSLVPMTSIGGSTPDDGCGALLCFQSFVDMIFFEHTKNIDSHILQDLVILRDALMRSHIDELVSHFARLPPLPMFKMPQGPFAILLRFMEPVVGAVILINGCTIGMESDIEWGGWEPLEFLFTVFFLLEILLKIKVYGCKECFVGADRRWNWFDTVVVGLAVIDLALSKITFSATKGFKDVSLVRLARLARLTRLMRLLRVLRLRMFKELLLMVKGIMAGLRTLFWAIVMLVVLVYACGVLLRQTVGEQHHVMQDKYNTVLFGSVPWSMFYTFRCFMSDCTLPDGTPVVGHLYEMYGFLIVIPYSLSMLFIVFGIFNMVTAVFVETVMEAARQRQVLSKEAEARRVAQLLRSLILKLASKPFDEDDKIHWSSTCESKIFGDKKSLNLSFTQRIRNRIFGTLQTKKTKVYSRNLQGEVTRETFHAALEDPETAKLIDDLEIHIGDRSELFDVLDSDGGGSLDVGELISGIMKMRSTETKQDVVALVLAVRSIRKCVQEMGKFMEESAEADN